MDAQEIGQTLYRIAPVSPLHVGPLVARLGVQREQLEAMGARPRAYLRRRIAQARYASTATIDGKPVAMWGVDTTIASAEGDVWLAVTDIARRHVVHLARAARAELNWLLDTMTALNTAVLVEDERAFRWCRFLGFEVVDMGRDEASREVYLMRKER